MIGGPRATCPARPGTATAATCRPQSLSHNNYPHAQAFLTECSGGELAGYDDEAFALTMDSVIGEPRNWGQSVILWNLAWTRTTGPPSAAASTAAGWSP